MKSADLNAVKTPAQLITDQITELSDWRGKLLARLRQLVHEALPGITEEWKWGVPVWSLNGPVCSAAAFKDHVKLNFFKGASVADPGKLFNAGFEAKATRAIDFMEGSPIDESALKALIRTAGDYNQSSGKKK